MRYIVELNNVHEYDKALDIFSELNINIIKYIWPTATFVIEADYFDANDFDIFQHSLQDAKLLPSFTPNDTYYSDGDMWHIDRINLPTAWNSTFGNNVTIAIADSGINASHADLAENILPGYCVVTDTTTTTDIFGHGTWCAGFAAAIGNNNSGIIGAAPMAKILPIRITTDSVSGVADLSNMMSGVIKAVEMGAKIISLSYQIAGYEGAFASTIAYLADQDALLFVCAGNDGTESCGAHGENMLYVGGMDATNTRIYNYGVGLDLIGPASNLTSTHRNGTYSVGTLNGTSFSTPITAGVAALIRAKYPSLSSIDIRRILCESANDTLNGGWTAGWDNYKGHGCLDAGAALSVASTWKRVGYRKPIAYFNNISDGSVFVADNSVSVGITVSNAYNSIFSTRLFLNDVEVASGTTLSSYSLTVPSGENILRLKVVDVVGDIVDSSISFIGITNATVSTNEAYVALENNGVFQARIRSKNATGDSAWSAWTTLSTPNLAPSPNITPLVNYTTPGYAKVMIGAVMSATSYNLIVDEVDLGVISPTAPVDVPLKLVTQIAYIIAGNDDGTAASPQIALERLAPVAVDQSLWYAVNVSSTNVNADNSFTYTISGSVVKDTTSSYIMQASVSRDTVLSYVVQGAVSQDITISYDILSAAVFKDLVCAYAVFTTDTVDSTLIVDYVISASVSSDISANYSVNSGVASSLDATYTMSNSVYSDVTTVYSIIDATSGEGAVVDVSSIWNHTLSNGLTAGETLVQLHQFARELALINGLIQGQSLTVTPSSRIAGSVSQSIVETGSAVTMTRL